MSAKIKYEQGQAVGVHGVTFLRDALPLEQKNKHARSSWFICPVCQKPWLAQRGNVKDPKRPAKSCCGTGSLSKLGLLNYKGAMIKTASHHLYAMWSGMKQRCLNPASISYHYYGGRGIKVCDKWISFKGFLEDMDSSYFDGAEIDRIDNREGYCLANCRWVTRKENNRNKRNNAYATYKGQTKLICDWLLICQKINPEIKENTYRSRIRRGYTWDELFLPTHTKR